MYSMYREYCMYLMYHTYALYVLSIYCMYFMYCNVCTTRTVHNVMDSTVLYILKLYCIYCMHCIAFILCRLSVLPSVYPLLSGVVFWLSNVLAVASYVGEDAGCTFTTPEWQKALTNVIQYAFQNLSYPVTMVSPHLSHTCCISGAIPYAGMQVQCTVLFDIVTKLFIFTDIRTPSYSGLCVGSCSKVCLSSHSLIFLYVFKYECVWLYLNV